MDADARQRALRYYSGSERCLEADLGALARNPGGIICWTPRLVALAKPVESGKPAEWMRLSETPSGADGWYIHLLVGSLDGAVKLANELPPLMWLCFQRGLRSSRPHVLPWHRILSM